MTETMPGWRIAYMVGNERMIDALSHMKTYLDYGTFAPLQLASAWALEHGDRFADEIRNLYKVRAHALVEGLRAAGWPDVAEPSGTMFVWTKIPKAFGGKPIRRREVDMDFSGYVAELLAKATSQNQLSGALSKDEKDGLLQILRSWGALDKNYEYRKGPFVSYQRGYAVEPGGGVRGA